mgnify:CR=1 FL=1
MNLLRFFNFIYKNSFFLFPIFLLINCSDFNKSSKIDLTEILDSFPRLSPKDFVLPKSSSNKKCPLICYYNNTLKVMFYTSNNMKGKFNCKSKEELITFYPHNLDSIFLVYNDSIITVNNKGVVLNSVHYENKFKYNQHNYSIGKLMYDYPNCSYINDKNVLLIQSNYYDNNWWSKDFFINSMIITGINVNNGKLTMFNNIKYPNQYFTNCYAEHLNYYFTINDKSEIIFSFEAIPSLFSFKINSTENNLKIIDFSGLNEVPTFDTSYSNDMNMIMEYHKNVNKFLKVIYDPYKDLYYRFYYLPTINFKQKEHGSFQSNFDTYLTVYNNNFKEIFKRNFGDSINPFGTFLSNKGLHIKSYKQSDKYEYYKILSFNNFY